MRVLIKGAGDVASGIAYRLRKGGHSVLMLEQAVPTTVRRNVAFSRAVYEKEVFVEDVKAILVTGILEVWAAQKKGRIAVVVDKDNGIIKSYQPHVVIDAILAKKNLGTGIFDAGMVVGVGPGFVAGEDCHAVIETNRGHDLGRVIWEGSAAPDTKIPGDINGITLERIVRATANGIFSPLADIGELVEEGQVIARIGEEKVLAPIKGAVRGLLQEGVMVTVGMKAGDIDPRAIPEYCSTISDKARAIGGAALEIVSWFEHEVPSDQIVWEGI